MVDPGTFPRPAPLAGAMNASAVSETQKQLMKLGFLQQGGTPTGALNSATKQAISNFQSNYGLATDGRVGQQTTAALSYYAGRV